jgi:hypothetical protein
MLIARRKASATPVLGTFTTVIPHSVDAILRQVYISPATQTTTFDFTVSDPDGNVFEDHTDIKGRYNDNHVDLPTDAPMTLALANASANELFTIIFCFET